MKALRSASVLLFAFFLLLPGTVLAQEETETLTISLNRDFGYGGFDGRIQGRFTLTASGAEDLVPVALPCRVLFRECLEAPCRANHLQKVDSAFQAPPVDAMAHSLRC